MLFSSKFVRAIFVRHPLERLASAYTDKIGSLKNIPFSYYDTIRRIICRRYSSFYLTNTEQTFYRINKRIVSQMNEPCATIAPTFKHFVEFLLSNSLQHDVHFQSYSNLCRICLFKYNFIGKYETINEDFERLISYLGLKSNDWNHENYFRTGKSRKTYLSMYANLTNELICKLKAFYQKDFELFDYRLEDYLIGKRTVQCSSANNRTVKQKKV